jgi:hypothetical protein
MITARKIQVTIVSDNRDEAYRFIRNEMREQNKALNVGMNHLYFNYVARQKLRLRENGSYVHIRRTILYISAVGP